MSERLKKCLVCKNRYQPNPRTQHTQRVCEKDECRKERKRLADQAWRRRNPDYEHSRCGKRRLWAGAQEPSYWKQYRSAHPEGVERNRAQTRERMRAQRKMFANQDAIRRDPVGYLEDLRIPRVFANQDAMARPVDGILTYLVQKARFANHDDMASQSVALA